METRNIFQNLSCLDHRYSLSEKEVFGKLSQYISEEAAVRSYAKAEAALIKAHLSVRGQLTSKNKKKLDPRFHLFVEQFELKKKNLDVYYCNMRN